MHLERYRALVLPALKGFLAVGQPALKDILSYHIGWADEHGRASGEYQGGKALRPSLCLFVCEAVGGDPHVALPAAVALEYIHNYSLIHDDIQDGDIERRRRPTVWYLKGKPQAVWAGNTLQALASSVVEELIRRGVGLDRALEAYHILNRGCLQMIEGQCLDLSYEGAPGIAVEEYLNMVAFKTGALMEASAGVGALLGGGDERVVEAFQRWGHLLGLAFQIRDDILGIWGTEATGKSHESDIRRRKKTLPVVYAMAHLEGEAAQHLKELYKKKEVGDGEVARVMKALEVAGSYSYSQGLAREKGRASCEALEEVPLTSRAREEIEGLVEFVVTRES